ncbi:hypothetical protein ACNOYE_07210 [Nannocystaceae bacterium ST9]
MCDSIQKVKWGAALAMTLLTACNNEDLPDGWEPTVGDTVGDEIGDESGDESDTGPEPVSCWEPDGYQPEDPNLFQCVGEGEGVFQYIKCGQLLGCTAEIAGECNFQALDNWESAPIGVGPFMFPPEPPETEPDARACCETNSSTQQVVDGCEADCARGACNIALAELNDALDSHINSPPGGCGENTACFDRVVEGLTTWINYLESNYDDCVDSVRKGVSFIFPNPDVDSGPGALACASLEASCTIDENEGPFDLEQACVTSENEPQEAGSFFILECDLEGEAEVSGIAGNDFTELEGSVVLRRENGCTTPSCWFSIDSLEFIGAPFSSGGYASDDMRASLAFDGFGLVDASTDEGSIAQRMFALDVVMDGDLPMESEQSYGFRMGNSDSAIFEVSTSQFQIVDAYFEWDDHAVVITTDLANCTCLNCTL